MADLGEMYGVPADAPALSDAERLQAAARKHKSDQAAQAAANLRAQTGSHSTAAAPDPTAALTAQPGRLFEQAQADADAEARQEAEIAARHQAQAAAPGLVNPFALAARSSAEDAQAIARRLDDANYVTRSRSSTYAPTRDMIEAKRELLPQERQNLLDAQDIEGRRRLEQLQLAEETQQTRARMELRAEVLEAGRVRKQQEIESNVAQYRQATDEARNRFAQMEQLDPAKAYADQKAGQKVRMFFAALGAGLRGGDPRSVFNDFVQREMAAHKAQSLQLQQEVGNAEAAERAATNDYSTFLAMAGDDRVAEAMLREHTLNKLSAKMDRVQAEYGARAMTPEFAEAQRVLAEQQADAKYALDMAEANNPKYIYRRRSTLGRNERRVLQGLADANVKGAAEAVKQGLGAERDTLKTRGTAAAARQKSTHDQKKWLAKETESLRVEAGLIDDFKREYGDDIPGVNVFSRVPGVNATAQAFSQDARDARQKLKRIVKLRLRRESGAAISEDELNDEAEAILDARGESDVFNDLTRRENEARSRIDYLTRATDEEIESEYLARPVGPRGALTQGGASQPSSLRLDE